MAGMSVLPVACDDDGNIEIEDLRAKAKENREGLAALMVTYPSTHGVFEESRTPTAYPERNSQRSTTGMVLALFLHVISGPKWNNSARMPI